MRDATANLLDAQDGFEVYGTFDSAAEYLASASPKQSGVLLLDCDGDTRLTRIAVSSLVAADRRAKVVLLCQELTPETIGCAMEHRVSGVILKSYSTEDVRHAIRYMASGRTVMPAGWQRVAPPIRREPLALSPRLQEILVLIAKGASNEEIASELALSPSTIKSHVRSLYARLGVRNRVEAAILHAQMSRGAAV